MRDALFNIVQPDIAYFGEKDAQQLTILQQMVKDLNFAVRIVPVATVREPDGLALSSRNVRLTPQERRVAPLLFSALTKGQSAILAGERDPRKVLPMREQMAQHRANPVCAGCHAQMDQLGFALENFDAIGEWRDAYSSGAAVDARAELPDGTKINGPAELRKVLLNHGGEFLTTITEKLLTYALGRGLEAADAPAVRQIKRDAARADPS